MFRLLIYIYHLDAAYFIYTITCTVCVHIYIYNFYLFLIKT
uniref:Uncharacterized protein n=1 Tax=Anguilla anguilla TaxID=7936 RepID=A0A0E9TSJ3_ANGAN